MGYQNVFQRYELKYLVTREQQALLLEAMSPYMKPDEYGRSVICNIYYDTPDYLLVRRSLEAPVYKEKFRVRSYGTATGDSEVFLELKKKYKGVVYKRRIGVKEREAENYLQRGGRLQCRNQITEEIDYFRERYPGLAPTVYLSYEREAHYGREDRNLRVTFDENILWRREKLSLCAKPYGESLLEPGRVLLEVKIAGAMPLWLCRTLAEQGIYKTSFSKYGSAYRRMEAAGSSGMAEGERVLGGSTVGADIAEIGNAMTGGRKYA